MDFNFVKKKCQTWFSKFFSVKAFECYVNQLRDRCNGVYLESKWGKSFFVIVVTIRFAYYTDFWKVVFHLDLLLGLTLLKILLPFLIAFFLKYSNLISRKIWVSSRKIPSEFTTLWHMYLSTCTKVWKFQVSSII